MRDPMRFSSAVGMTAIALAFSSLATAQEPSKPAPKLPPAIVPNAADIASSDIANIVTSARLAQSLARERTIRVGTVTWICRSETCTTTNLAAGSVGVRACQQLRDRIGQIEAFGQSRRSLSGSELAECNSTRLQAAAADSDRKVGADQVTYGAGEIQAAPRPLDSSSVDPEIARRAAACPDPAAVDISARLVSHHGWDAVLDIIGVVRNVGFGPYRSESGQERRQSVELIEENPDGADPTVQRGWFSDLERGQEVRVIHRITWNTEPLWMNWGLGRGRWYPPLPPPQYHMRIAYAAANDDDDNWRNDDCNRHNNAATLEPEEITAVVP